MNNNLVEKVYEECTREWLEVFRKDKAEGKDLAASFFWRMAIDCLPEGVDETNLEVQAAIEEIRMAIAKREKGGL